MKYRNSRLRDVTYVALQTISIYRNMKIIDVIDMAVRQPVAFNSLINADDTPFVNADMKLIDKLNGINLGYHNMMIDKATSLSEKKECI